jgi:hypothetical protein
MSEAVERAKEWIGDIPPTKRKTWDGTTTVTVIRDLLAEIIEVMAEKDLCQKRIFGSDDEIDALTDCLNGSSKATYTAKMYDKGIEAAHQAGIAEAVKGCVEIINKKTWYIPTKYDLDGICYVDHIIEDIEAKYPITDI